VSLRREHSLCGPKRLFEKQLSVVSNQSRRKAKRYIVDMFNLPSCRQY
jgi:hypothetical protein